MKAPNWLRQFLWGQTYRLQSRKPAVAVQKTSAWLILLDGRDAIQMQTAQLLKTQVYPRVCRCVTFEPDRVEEWFIPLWQSQLDLRFQSPPNVRGVVGDNHYAFVVQLIPEPHPAMLSLELLAPATYRIGVNSAVDSPYHQLTCRWTGVCDAPEASRRIVSHIEQFIGL